MSKLNFNFVLDSIDGARRISIYSFLNRKQSGNLSALETWFEECFPEKKAVCVSSGRFGLYALLKWLLSEKQNSANVIIPGFSCVVVSNAVRAAGCQVRYADLEKHELKLSHQSVDSLIDSNTIAIVVQHVFGVIDQDIISHIRNKYPSVTIIEDCAHSLGGRYLDGTMVGQHGDFAFYSFEQSKVVTAWTGGVVIGKTDAINSVRLEEEKTRRPSWYSDFRIFLKMISHYWAYRKTSGSVSQFAHRVFAKLLRFEASMDSEELQGVFKPEKQIRFSEAQAACVLSQLRVLNENIRHRSKLAKLYRSHFKSVFNTSENATMLRFSLLVENKNEFMQKCSSLGLTVGNWFSTPIHPCSVDNPAFDYQAGSCPNSEYLARHIINLPTALKYTKDDASKVAQIIHSVEQTTHSLN